MIDAKVYRKLGGLDPKLSGRDQMLDFCLRAKKAGYRTIVDPRIIVKSPGKQDESSRVSHEAMLEKWQICWQREILTIIQICRWDYSIIAWMRSDPKRRDWHSICE